MPLRDAAVEVPLLANLLKTQRDYSPETPLRPPVRLTARPGETPDKALWEAAAKRGHHRIAQGRPFWQRALFYFNAHGTPGGPQGPRPAPSSASFPLDYVFL
jgi:hypothetical protein